MNVKTFRDCLDYIERLEELLKGYKVKGRELKELEPLKNWIEKTMTAYKFAPNKLQMAVAVAATHRLIKY